jgi:hypothetical protein
MMLSPINEREITSTFGFDWSSLLYLYFFWGNLISFLNNRPMVHERALVLVFWFFFNDFQFTFTSAFPRRLSLKITSLHYQSHFSIIYQLESNQIALVSFINCIYHFSPNWKREKSFFPNLWSRFHWRLWRRGRGHGDYDRFYEGIWGIV